MSVKITQVEFLRIFITAITVILVYFPLSIYGFIGGISCPRHPYSWEDIYAIRWSIIIKLPAREGVWGHWLGPVMAVQVFCLMGMTKRARQLFEICVEWIYDHSPSEIQISWMRKISAKCKQARLAEVGELEL